MKRGVFDRLKEFFGDLAGRNGFGSLDFGVLKTMLMLAAVDGDVSADEIVRFREMAARCRGYDGASFEALWESALRSAGYLLLQSRFLAEDELAAAFVREAEREFVGEVIQEVSKDRTRAFESLTAMAAADGDYSVIERKCIEALSKRVKEARDQAIAERYPRAMICERGPAVQAEAGR